MELLEHVNLVCASRDTSEAFYLRALGCALDRRRANDPRDAPRGVIWANIGPSQFHVPSPGAPQRIDGHVALGFADLAALRARLAAAEQDPALAGTQFAHAPTEDGGEEVVVGPHGNRFCCRQLDAEAVAWWRARGRHPGADSLGSALLHVEWNVPRGAAAGIAAFYREFFRAATAQDEDEDGQVLTVRAGPGQALRFRETDRPGEYDDHHIAVYIHDFEGTFRRLEAAGRIFTNPLFDLVNGQPIADTLPKALDTRQFRVIDLGPIRLEHEVRCATRPGCPLARPRREGHVPVLVVGGGPTGLAAGVALDAAGLACAVADPHEAVPPQPKGQTVSYRTVEHFERWGLREQLLAAAPLGVGRVPPRQFYTDGLRSARRLAANTLTHFAPCPELTPFTPPRMPQNLTQEVMLSRLRESERAELWLGWRVVELAPGDAGVRAVLQRGEEETRELTADYVVGCDGGRSFVREAAGGRLEGDAALIPVLGVEVRSEDLTRRLHAVGHGISYWVVGGAYRVSAVVTYSEHDWYVNITGPGVADVAADDEEALRALLFEAMEGEFDVGEIRAAYHWSVHKLVADSFRPHPRVFLAGDAAHLMSPTGGLNMNYGIEDAVNLAWKLHGVVTEWARPAILDSYDAERRPWALRAADFSYRIAAEMARIERECPPRSRPEEYEAQLFPLWRGKLGLDLDVRYSSSSSSDEPWDGAVVHPVVRAGHRLPHVQLADGRSLLQCLNPAGFTVIYARADCVAQVARLSSVCASINAPSDILDVRESALEDFPGCVFVRPDGMVAYASGGPADEDLVAVVRRVSGRLI